MSFSNPLFAAGVPPTQTPLVKNKNTSIIVIALVIGVLGLCGCCGLIGMIAPKQEKSIAVNVADQPTNSTASSTPVPTATPTPPPTFAQLKERAQTLLKMSDKAEYTTDEVKPFDEVKKLLSDIPKDSKDYKEAQALFTQLNKKQALLLAEILVLGPKPTNSAYDGNVAPAQNYLKTTLKDYSSSEYINWSPVAKVYVGKEPYWATRVKIRAKNSFGAYVVNDIYFLIRQNQVVKAETE